MTRTSNPYGHQISHSHIPPVKTRTTCRACGSEILEDLYSLGDQYVSDFVPPGQHLSGIRCPIDIVLCRGCTLVQMRHTAPQEILYSRHYWYRSGVTDTMRRALADVASRAAELVGLKEGDVVLDIGSNDGTLLRSLAYRRPGVVKVGIEPASNLVEEGKQGLDLLINDFWELSSFQKHLHDHLVHTGEMKPENLTLQARIITALGMMYDLEDPQKFISDIGQALHPEGVFVAQLMCLRNMIRVGDLGNLAHEHLEHYTLKSLKMMYDKAGMEIFDIETNLVNGESYRIYAQKKGSKRLVNFRVQLAFHVDTGLDDVGYHKRWFEEQEQNKAAVRLFIESAVEAGKTVYVYGASTKGNVLLQYYHLDNRLITAAAERSPEKWGKVTVGTGIPIISEEEARKARPDYFLVLPYAFLREFVQREKSWLQQGGKFIVPLPKMRIVDWDMTHGPHRTHEFMAKT